MRKNVSRFQHKTCINDHWNLNLGSMLTGFTMGWLLINRTENVWVNILIPEVKRIEILFLELNLLEIRTFSLKNLFTSEDFKLNIRIT